MTPRRVLFTGTGRCGTTYVATTLAANGVGATHQAIRHEHVLAGSYDWPDGLEVEASYEAVPLLPQLRNQVDRVVLLVRHPVAVATSWLQLGLFTGGWEQAWGDLYAVLERHAPVVLEQPTPAERALWFWLEWNRLAFRHADQLLLAHHLTPELVFTAARRPIPEGPLVAGDRNQRTDDKRPAVIDLMDQPLGLVQQLHASWDLLRRLAS